MEAFDGDEGGSASSTAQSPTSSREERGGSCSASSSDWCSAGDSPCRTPSPQPLSGPGRRLSLLASLPPFPDLRGGQLVKPLPPQAPLKTPVETRPGPPPQPPLRRSLAPALAEEHFDDLPGSTQTEDGSSSAGERELGDSFWGLLQRSFVLRDCERGEARVAGVEAAAAVTPQQMQLRPGGAARAWQAVRTACCGRRGEEAADQ